jgi:hypothetical protein
LLTSSPWRTCHPEDGDDMLHQNANNYIQDHMAPQSRGPQTTTKISFICFLYRVVKSCLVRFQVLTVASMKIRAFWDIAPFSLVGVDRHFRGVYCLRYRATPTRLNSATSQKALIFKSCLDMIITIT